nr:immunoglobulin light chain junction region [Macaca mulatta]MOW73086.1 immunoglobulin light chain junction region [Macaca mulatta]MOW73148.1 immunoglobulin light chain junction region [Macaca mulatta]MOW73202.1 immunoglobulin light chain junction region [Macaca mulatta]MOW73205.1 immunoglobulin light chain junction region [Macaca mulatta]
CLQYISAPYSF